MHLLSRGTVHIGSSDPLAPPLIDPKYFANDTDSRLLAHIIAFTIKLSKTSSFVEIVRSTVDPGPSNVGFEEGGLADRLPEYVKQTVGTLSHQVGTAAMLPLEDGGVVDSSLKVYGTTNLHVADASILPMVCGFNSTYLSCDLYFCNFTGAWLSYTIPCLCEGR